MAPKFTTRITEMLGIDVPILCGGMQWLSRAPFVAEVCNAGGLGFVSAETFEDPEGLREELKILRDLTDRPFGVNISMLPEVGNIRERTRRLLDIVCEERVCVVETAGRSPEPLVPALKEAGIKIIHKLTSVRHALSAEKAGVDAVALLGFGSGGHIGLEEVASFISIPLAVKQLGIPVVAAGGIADGSGFLGALAMGAEGILMGSRFLATDECPVSNEIKQCYVDARENKTAIIMTSIKNPMRCIRNELTEAVRTLEDAGASLPEVLRAVRGGRDTTCYDGVAAKECMLPCGQSIGLIDEIKPVRRVIEDMISLAGERLDRLNSLFDH